MTRSVDHQDQRSFIGSQGQSSIFGSKGAMVSTRMHLNKNTTLELIDSSQKKDQSSARKMSPFSVKAQRKKFVEERGQAIQAQILKQYSIEPFEK